MLTIFIRAILLYCILVLTMRGMGKRQLGQYQPYEFVMAMLIANLIAAPMSEVSTPLLYGLLPIAALYVLHSLISLLSMRSDNVRAFLSGKPSLIISKGVIQQDELKRLCLTLSDLLEGIRQAGIMDPAEVGTAILEADGSITAFPYAVKRPPNAEELSVDPGYEGLPMVLIMDGRVQAHNLSTARLERAWLNRQLTSQRLTEGDVFLASLDTHGRMSIQNRNGDLIQFQAIAPDEVQW